MAMRGAWKAVSVSVSEPAMMLRFLVCAGAVAAMSADAQVSLNSGAVIVVDPREPAPIQKAARDLASDFGKVFGKPARIAAEARGPAVRIACEIGAERPAGREAFRIEARGRALHITGSDVRGAIYGIYEFSQRYLGVDPFYWWTDHDPPRRGSIRIPAGTRIESRPPTFRYRGWFINDEDLLTLWKPGAADGTGIALEVWDRVYEALLRLKGNLIVPGTFLFPDEPQIRLASERGLTITQHHIEVLGLNTFRWPADQPYSFFSRPDLLVSAWTAAVRGYRRDQEVLWTVGYRGRHDRPFWSDDAGAPGDEAGRAGAIAKAIDRQIEIVHRERPGQPYFLMNAWMEAVPFIRNGLLKIPSGVTLVWPDNGYGVIRDAGAIAAGQGVYYHTAMYSSRANQLSEMVPLERIQRELGRAARAGATEYLLVNTSDIRPVPMTTRAVMELAWNAEPWLDPNGAGDYLRRWSREEFGEKAAPLVEACYRAYFQAPGRYGPAEHETLADNAYHTMARDLLVRLIKGEPTPNAARLAVACREAEPRWEKTRKAATKAAPAVPAARREFFGSHVLTQIGVNLHSNAMLLQVAEALAGEPSQRKRRLEMAAGEIREVQVALKNAEYGKWAGFYKGDLFVDVRHTADLVRAAAAKIETGQLPAGVEIAVRPADPYHVLKAYQGERKVPLQ